MTVKDRHLPIPIFLENLETEYLMCEFRSRIYVSPADKRYYKRVMGYKKDKILSISERNGLPTMFQDEAIYKEKRKKLFDAHNRPIFQLTAPDALNYYSKDAWFKDIRTSKVGILQEADLNKGVLKISFQNSVKILKFEEASRVL